MIHITEFETNRSAFIFGTAQNQVTIRINCDDEGLKEINKRIYGIKSPSRSMVEGIKDCGTSAAIKGILNGIYGTKIPIVKRILISGMCTIVFWLDGTKNHCTLSGWYRT